MKKLVYMLTLLFTSVMICSGAEKMKIAGIRDESAESTASHYHQAEAIPSDTWRVFEGGQNCKGTVKRDSKANRFVADFSFSGEDRIEYLAVGAPFELTKKGGGRYFGIKADVRTEDGAEPICPFCIRLVDPSGEYHQIYLNIICGDWLLGRIGKSSPHWGGDDNGKLEFPCKFSCLIMDRAESKWKVSGRLTVHDIRFFDYLPSSSNATVTITETYNFSRAGTAASPESPTVTIPEIADRINLGPSKKGSETLKVKIVPQKHSNVKTADLGKYEIHVARQVNERILPSEFVKPDVNGEITLERGLQTGFESFILTPVLSDNEGRKVFDQPIKYSFAGLPEIKTLNRWFGTTTHLNFPNIDKVPLMGMGMIRDEFHWGGVERKKGEFFYNEDRDRYFTLVKKLDVETLLILDYANNFYDGGNFPHTDEAVAGFAEYCGRMAEHLKGRCRYYEIWNEWSGGCGMSSFISKGHHNTPENYVKLLKAASAAIRKADPDAYIIGGGGDHHVGHFKQIEAMMKLGVMKYCDAFSVHPYVYPRTPEKANVRADVQKVIDVMKANGCEHPKLWLTELGWPTHRSLSRDPAICSTSFTLENYSAAMLARCVLIYRSMPEIEKFFWYDLENDGTDMNYNENNFGLLHNRSYGAQPKASYSVMAFLTQILDDAKVTEDQTLSNENRMVFRIEKKDGSVYLAAWSPTGKSSIDIPNVEKVFGMYGNEEKVERRDLGICPVFFRVK